MGVNDDIERRLSGAAASLREYEVVRQWEAELGSRAGQLSTDLATLRASCADEEKDVARLEGVSLTRVLAALRGSREDALARERAEADAARYRVAQAQARLDAIHRERAGARARLAELSTAGEEYAAVLREKEAYLTDSGDGRGGRLLELATERGRLTGEARECAEAVRAARTASAALARVEELLGSASSWSTYDTFLGGGAFSSAIKHDRLEEAAQAASYADRCLAVLRTELADVGIGLTAPQLAVAGTTRFVDIWFDNIFTDLSVRDQIQQSQRNVARSVRIVHDLRASLDQRAAQAHTRLAAIESERQALLTRA